MLTLFKPGRIALALVLIAILLTTPDALRAQVTVLSQPVPDHHLAKTSGPTDPAELEAFLDGIIEPQMKLAHIAGATVAVVRDGEVLLTKGYGSADVARSIPVRPESTLFQIGSITKLFTWTAVMQLVEQGRLDLDADVNTYLDFKIPATYLQPLTLKHLMTHTPGFEDITLGMFPARLDQIRPLGRELATHMPARVRPPGQIASYSNYGAGLAGYIVERVSGMSYEEYVEKNIFQPLGMEHTGVRQPLPAHLVPDLALGYRDVNGSLQAQDVQWVSTPPAGAISATASDMARFMIAQLENGSYGDTRILEEPTARQMHSTLFKMDERVNGFAYGFFERDMNGQRVIGHGGSTLIFNGDLILLPEQKLGLFVSFNTYTAAGVVEPLVLSFMNHYYPLEPPSLAPTAELGLSANELAGSYRLTRRSYTTAEKITGLLRTMELTPASEGALFLDVTQSRLLPVGALLFREEKTGLPVVFRRDGSGNITHLLIGNRPDQTYEKLAWYEGVSVQLGLLLVCTLVFLSVFIIAPAGWLVNRFRASRAGRGPRRARVARWLLALVAALNVIALVDFVVKFIGNYETLENAVTKGDPSSMYLPLLLWLIAAILTVGAIAFTVLAWKERYWSALGRVHYTMVSLAALAFIWFLNYWNLLGWRI